MIFSVSVFLTKNKAFKLENIGGAAAPPAPPVPAAMCRSTRIVQFIHYNSLTILSQYKLDCSSTSIVQFIHYNSLTILSQHKQDCGSTSIVQFICYNSLTVLSQYKVDCCSTSIVQFIHITARLPYLNINQTADQLGQYNFIHYNSLTN